MTNPRTKNLALAGGAAALLGIIGVNMLVTPAAAPADPGAVPTAAAASPADPVASSPADPVPSAAAPVPASPASPGVSSAGAAAVAARRSYAVGLHDLRGLPQDAAPGARFELWVTWEPPITDEPRLQRLIGDVVLERMIPGSVPEAPVTVLLSVPAERTSDLIYADTFGKLSAVLPQ